MVRLKEECDGVSFFPRVAGPLSIVGPAYGVFDRPLEIARIACNEQKTGPNCFDYITWGNDTMAEYCLWSVLPGSGESPYDVKVKYYPRLIGNVRDEKWLKVRFIVIRASSDLLFVFWTGRVSVWPVGADGRTLNTPRRTPRRPRA